MHIRSPRICIRGYNSSTAPAFRNATVMWVKLCGMRDVESARLAAASMPDAIGLNFYALSPRSVSPSVAAEIVRELPSSVAPVGLFVNLSATEIAAMCRTVGIAMVQLHGDEPPELLAELHGIAPDLRIIRAFRIGPGGLDGVATYLEDCGDRGVPLFAFLLDAQVKDQYGGTGQLAPWDVIRREYRFADWPPLILAGGLTPDNVAAGITAVGPWGVDTAGGVESAPGVKDAELAQRFVESARGVG